MEGNQSRRDVLKRAGALTAAATVPATTAMGDGDGTGTLDITVYNQKVEDGELVRVPGDGLILWDTTDGEIYYGAENLGRTDENGQLTASIESGERELAVQVQYNRYSTAEDEGIPVQIEPGQTTELEYDFLADEVLVTVDYNTEYGKALYITGETEYLGNWQEAKKLDYIYYDDSSPWEFEERLPIGAEFKLVRDDWVDQEWISTDGVDWQQGPNEVIERDGPKSGSALVYPDF